MRDQKFSLKNQGFTSQVQLRLVLYPGEIYRLSGGGRGIGVRDGRAWVSHAGRDLVLSQGEQAWLPSAERDFALVSALGRQPLVFEVLNDDRRGISPSFYGSPGAAVMECR